MSDIVSRLLLDTKDYDSKLGKAKQSSNDFASDIGNKAANAVGKFAAGLGVAMGAAEAFDRMIKSSQTTGDKYAETLQTLKAGVDSFFYSISSGDWSSFLTGMDSVIAKAKEAYAAMDQLGNAQMSFGIAQAINQRDIAEAQQLAKNKFAPLDVRRGAFANWATAIGTQEAQSAQLKADIQDYITKAVESKAGIKGFEANMDNVMKGLLLDIQNKASRERLKDLYSGQYSEFETGLEAAAKERARRRGSSNLFERSTAESYYEDAVKRLTDKYNEAITVQSLLVKYSDEDLQAIGSHVKNMIGLDNSIAMLKREYNETANEFNNANKGVKGFTPLEAFEGYTVYSGTSEAAKNFTPKASGSKGEMKIPVVVGYSQYDTDLGRKVLDWMNGKDVPVIKVPIEIEGEDIEEAPLPITKQTVDMTNDYVNSINALSNVMTALNTQTVEGAAGWLSWAGSLMTASAMAVDSIRQVVAAKTAEGAASAGAEAAKTPFVGWLLVGGAVMSALAAFAAIPSFAEGGVVPGSNFRDGIAARLSSGEMVINPADQKKLFDSIHSGNLGGGGSSRSVITGEQIVTVVNNYGRRTGRGTILKG